MSVSLHYRTHLKTSRQAIGFDQRQARPRALRLEKLIRKPIRKLDNNIQDSILKPTIQKPSNNLVIQKPPNIQKPTVTQTSPPDVLVKPTNNMDIQKPTTIHEATSTQLPHPDAFIPEETTKEPDFLWNIHATEFVPIFTQKPTMRKQPLRIVKCLIAQWSIQRLFQELFRGQFRGCSRLSGGIWRSF